MGENEKEGEKKKDTEAQVDVGNKSPTTGTEESRCCCYLFKGKSALFRNRRDGWRLRGVSGTEGRDKERERESDKGGRVWWGEAGGRRNKDSEWKHNRGRRREMTEC